MYLVIGLGNTGEKYDNTRHNIGRAIVEAFGKKTGTDFTFNKKWNALVSEGVIANIRIKNKYTNKQKMVLLLPETFMNKSGNAVGPAARFYKTKPASVIVIHDDSDIELGRGKLSFNKSSAGHKGVESIIRALKTQSFWRFRIGIQKKRRVEAEKLVLQKFSPNDKKIITKVIKKTVDALESLIKESPEKTMNSYNT